MVVAKLARKGKAAGRTSYGFVVNGLKGFLVLINEFEFWNFP